MKTIFKGTINGREFNSVQSYNEEMMRALAAGESIHAESHTETVEDYLEEDVLKPTLHPYFDDKNDHYLDLLVSGDDSDEDKYREMTTVLENSINDIKEFIKKARVEELDDLKKIYKDILSDINDDLGSNEDCLQSLEERIKELQRKRNVCLNSRPVIDAISKFYKEALQAVSQTEVLNDDECDCNCTNCTKCTCKEKEPGRTYNLDKLMDAIFAWPW